MTHEDVPMSAPDLDESDVETVLDVLRSGRLALGPKAEEFERLVAAYVGVRHAVAVSSGTAALHLILRALDVKPGDKVLVPSFTFAASVNVILYERALPVFVDIDSETYNLDPEDAAHKIDSSTRAIMAVDVFGHPVEWDAILPLAQRYGLKVIDDACEALGAEYKGQRVGRFGDAAAFAFYPNKQMTTAEGGMIVTNDDDIARMVRSLRNQGRGEMGSWLEHEYLGFNYRMDELSAALGVSQFRRLDTLLAKRERVARLYEERLRDLDFIRPPVVRPWVRMSWFVYVVTLMEGLDRDVVARKLAEQGIPSRGYFTPIHQQPYIRRLGLGDVKLPVTERIARRTLALPFHNRMSAEQVDRVVTALERAVR